MKTKLNRRLFLRGLGGAAVAAPFLSSIQERPAHAQDSNTPKRFIVMFTHYGCLTNLWFPATSHGPLSAAELQERTLAPLAPFVDKLLLPRGIRAMNEWNFSHARGQGNDPHTNPTGSFFSCQPITPHNQVHEFNDAKSNAMPIDRTLDHVMAEQISPNAGGVPLYMRLGGFENEMSAISYSGPSERYSGLSSASQIYSNITGLFQDGAPMNPDTYAALKGQSVIDIVRDDLTRLEGFNMSGDDRQKLEAWKSLLEETGGVVTSAQCNEATAMALGLPGESAPDIMADVGGRDVADLFSDLAVLAAICDLNRVIFLKYPGNYTFSGLGHTGDSHGLSHRIGGPDQQGACVDGVLSMLEEIDRYYAEKFAYLVGRLDSFDEGEGTTVLDNSATVWFNELSDGNAHNMNNMPILQAGSCGGYFKTGQAVNLDGGTNDLTPGNSLGQCANPGDTANGISQATGTSPEIGSRPINKYFCNIMNAVGVKAGPDGFPMAGGTAEVTHFGRWDRTEDFRNGPDGEPPLISDPGEYSELRASI